MNRAVFEKLNYGLYVLGVQQDGKDYGCLVSSFAQVTSGNPRKCTITVNKDNRTADAILASGTVAVTMVAEGADRDVLKTFGYKSGRVVDKFENLPVGTDGNGSISNSGVSLSTRTTAEGMATVTVELDADKAVSIEAIEDMVGPALLKMEKMEATFAATIEEIKAEQKTVREHIALS